MAGKAAISTIAIASIAASIINFFISCVPPSPQHSARTT
jgi:hypothetical protein